MKVLITVLLVFATPIAIFAQKELPGFGQIDKSDLLLTQCEFDKDASACKLIDFGDVHYVSGKSLFKIKTDRRIRIKILKDDALNLANIKIKFYSKYDYEEISDISGVTYNLDNSGNIKTTPLDKTLVYEQKINKNYSQVAFTMPEVKVGSVIEYQFTELKDSYSSVDDWYFQDNIPTRLSVYHITVPSIFRFALQLLTYQKPEKQTEDINEKLVTPRATFFKSEKRTFILRDVLALRHEPFMGAVKDYLQRIEIQLSQIVYPSGRVEEVKSTWPELSDNLLEDEDFGLQLKKNIPHTAALDDLLRPEKSDYKKMLLIHDYVRRNMNWNSNENIYTGNGIKSAWDKKSGNNAEINFILINLLRDADITVYPILVSTKDNGMVNKLYPFLQQFNNTMACVYIDGKRYILNAADKYNPAGLMPYDVINTDAFIVDDVKGGWIILNEDKDIFQNTVSIFAEITTDGIMTGEATVLSSGYSKNIRLEKWKEDKTSFKDYFSKSFTGMKIENIEVHNDDIDMKPLEQIVKFSLPLSSSGDYEYFSFNLFQGLEKNPFIADERRTDIDFGYKQSFKVVSKIYIPDGYEFEELPKNVTMFMPDSSIVLKRLMQADSNSVDIKVTVDFTKTFYEAKIYPELQEFYKKLFAALNAQLVIKKKKNTL